jgi:Bacterial TSP3 repeat
MKGRARIRVACLLGLLALSLAPHAAASKTFPAALRNKLGLAELPYAPMGCQLCHQDDNGGVRTATKPFGRSVLKDGAAGGSVPSLLAALNTLEAEGTDSDGDGIGDIAELKAGTDPNVALSSTGEPLPMDEIPLPETGCGLARGRTASPIAWALLLGALCFGARRRRPQSNAT